MPERRINNVIDVVMSQPRTRVVGPFTVDSDATHYSFVVERAGMPVTRGDDTIIWWNAEISFDGGDTWERCGGAATTGGALTGRFGQVGLWSTNTKRLPPQVGRTERQLRFTFRNDEAQRLRCHLDYLVRG